MPIRRVFRVVHISLTLHRFETFNCNREKLKLNNSRLNIELPRFHLHFVVFANEHICSDLALLCLFIPPQPLSTWRPETCTHCICHNGTITCHEDDVCLSHTQPTSTTTTQSSTPPGSGAVTIPMITHPDCTFTNWINIDTPQTGGGDYEELSTIRETHEFCDNPVMINCRDSGIGLPPEDLGQTVTCDVAVGLRCTNSENTNGCFDYEVRFLCSCTSVESMLFWFTKSSLVCVCLPCENIYTICVAAALKAGPCLYLKIVLLCTFYCTVPYL